LPKRSGLMIRGTSMNQNVLFRFKKLKESLNVKNSINVCIGIQIINYRIVHFFMI